MRILCSVVLALAGLWTMAAQAQDASDKAALAGLKEVRIVFDLTNGDPRALARTLDVIDQTRLSLIRQGVTPHIVLAFRGPASRLVQTDASLLTADERAGAGPVRDRIRALSAASGIDGIEQCEIALTSQGARPQNIAPGIKVVGNGWISIAAYQAKGYGYIAP